MVAHTITIDHLPEQPGVGRLGRHIEHDARSLAYLVDEAIAGPLAAVSWPRYSPILDQGDIGSCTGNAMTGWLGCAPCANNAGYVAQFDENFAVWLYGKATRLDHIPGQYPPDDTGSTGLAVAKAAKQLGYISGYRHALTTLGLLRALQSGPVIVGVPWFEGFDHPDANGLVRATGGIRGGHEFLIRGYTPGASLGEGLLHADNSWGTGYGVAGSFMFSVNTWGQLRHQQADVTVPHL